MKYGLLGKRLREIRKVKLDITQKEFTELVDMDIKKLSRIETGIQLPDEEYFKALIDLKISDEEIEDIKVSADEAKRLSAVERHGFHPKSETMVAELETIKEVVIRNNLMLRQILKMLEKKPSQGSLLEEALKPLDF